MWRADLLEKSLLLRKTEGRRRRGQGRWDGWMASLTQWTEFEQGDSGGQKSLVYFSPWDHKRLDVTWWLNSNNKLHPYPWLTVINIARYIQKFIQPLWRTVWRFLKKLKIDLPYDSAISLTGWENHNSKRQKYPMLTAVLFTAARTWKQPRCPLTGEWIYKS